MTREFLGYCMLLPLLGLVYLFFTAEYVRTQVACILAAMLWTCVCVGLAHLAPDPPSTVDGKAAIEVGR